MRVNGPLAVLALGLVIPAFSCFAEESNNSMSAEREKAIRECSVKAAKYKQYTWGKHELTIYRVCMAEHGRKHE